MKKIIPIIILALSLTGCASLFQKQEQPVVVKYEYIVRVPPKELMTIPDPVKPIDTSKATQADVAQWIVDLSKRSDVLENKIKSIADFLNKPVEQKEQPKKDQK